MRRQWVGCMVAAVALVSPQEAAARRIIEWSYEDLLKGADLVVVARATASEWDGDPQDPGPDGLVGVKTRFSVNLTVKGEVPKSGLTVLHYWWGKAKSRDELERRARNPPHLVQFRTDAMRIQVAGTGVQVPTPDYLLFLKKRPDGQYEPVSGQTDPDQSVRELIGALSQEREAARDDRPRTPDPTAAKAQRDAARSMAYMAILDAKGRAARYAPGLVLDRSKRLLLAPDLGEAKTVRVAFPAINTATGDFESDAQDLRDRTAGRRATEGEVIARDTRRGLALVRLDRDPPDSATMVRLADRVDIGAMAWRVGVGVPDGWEFGAVAAARVRSVGPEDVVRKGGAGSAGRPRVIVTTLDSAADAEGPLLDRRGALLGLSRPTDDLHRTQAFIYVDEIREFLKENKIELPVADSKK